MKKGEQFIGTVERVDFPNKGIVKFYNGDDELTATVKDVIPGQRISFSVTKTRSERIEGRLLSVVEKSPNEIESPCPHFGKCGGCTYINMTYEEQLKMKDAQVRKLLKPVLDKQIENYIFEEIKASPKCYEFRNKMEFSFGDEYKGGPLALGMHQKGSFFDVVSVKGCQIVDEDYRAILTTTLEYFDGIPFYHRMSHEGYLRHLLVRKAQKTGQILIALVTTSNVPDEMISLHKGIDEWKNLIVNLKLAGGLITGILHIKNDSMADAIKVDTMDQLYGNDYITEELLGLQFKISTFSFFQTNSSGAEVLYSTAREFIGDLTVDSKKEATVFDLYSGTGTIAQLMAPVAKKVIGVEIVEEAVIAARENAKLNGLHNCEFIAGDVLKVLDDIEDKPDFIILDPPRDGVNPKALKKIIDYGVDRLIYIACKPTSLARDLEYFQLAGYHVERVCAVDQFPWSANIETIALLSRETSRPAKDY